MYVCNVCKCWIVWKERVGGEPDVMAPPLFRALKRSAFGTAALGAAEAFAATGAATAATAAGAADTSVALNSVASWKSTLKESEWITAKSATRTNPFFVLFQATPVVWCAFT